MVCRATHGHRPEQDASGLSAHLSERDAVVTVQRKAIARDLSRSGASNFQESVRLGRRFLDIAQNDERLYAPIFRYSAGRPSSEKACVRRWCTRS